MTAEGRPSDQHRDRLLEEALQGREQFRAERAVDDAVIAGQRHASSGWRSATPPSSVSTGRRCAAPTARMVACGGLMMAENSRTPYMPRLEIAVDAALIFLRLELLVARAGGELLHLGRDRAERFHLGAGGSPA